MFDHELSYLVTSGSRILQAGLVPLPKDAVINGRIISPIEVGRALRKAVRQEELRVAVVLPTALTHVQQLNLPTELDAEELEYQVSSHISQSFGISTDEVFYDYTRPVFNPLSNRDEATVVMARQTEIAQYKQVFEHTNWSIGWICAEPLIWTHLNASNEAGLPTQQDSKNQIICQVEYDHLSLWWTNPNGHLCYQTKQFDAKTLAQTGFIYQSDDVQVQSLKLPNRFAIEEIEMACKQWVNTPIEDISILCGIGSGVSWDQIKQPLQSQLGIPVHPFSLADKTDVSPDRQGQLAAVWSLSQQISRKKGELLNLWPDTQPQNRFNTSNIKQEVIFATLLTLLISGSTYAYLSYTNKQTRAVNQALQTEINSLSLTANANQANSDVLSEDRLTQLIEIKKQVKGKLDWMDAIGRTASTSLKWTEVIEDETGLTLSGIADSPQVAASAVTQLNQSSDDKRFFRISKLDNQTVRQKDHWLMVVRAPTGSGSTAPDAAADTNESGGKP